MKIAKTGISSLIACAVILTAFSSAAVLSARPAGQSSGAAVRAIGTVLAVNGSTIKVKTDQGAELVFDIQSSTRLLRIQPGQKSLKDATPLSLNDLQVGDRVLVFGMQAQGASAAVASSVIAIKRSDIAQKQQAEEEAWQKHGVGGIVKTVEPDSGTIVLAPNAEGKTITIATTKNTIYRRYAPGSVRFQDAKPGTFSQIQPGNQLRARGALNAAGTEITAAAIVSGAFENIAGTVLSVDSSASKLTVFDLVEKRPVTVDISPSTQMRELPKSDARQIAMRLHPAERKGSAARAGGSNAASAESAAAAGPNLDELFRGLPQIPLSDLHKGDMVMVVSTEGATPGSSTAVKLVSGVAPILSASRGGNQGKKLQSLWSGFGSTGGGEGDSTGASAGSAGASQNK